MQEGPSIGGFFIRRGSAGGPNRAKVIRMRQMGLCHPSPMEVCVPGARVYNREEGRERWGRSREREKDGETAT